MSIKRAPAERGNIFPESYRRRDRKRFKKDDVELLAISLPTVFWYLLFTYVPMFGIVFAFKKYRLDPKNGFLYSVFVNSDWVGLENFGFIFKTPDVMRYIGNTLSYNITFLVIGAVLPVTLAIIIQELHSKKLAKVCQTAIFMPHFLSWTVVSYFAFAFLSQQHGLINKLLESLGSAPIRWYSEPERWPFLLILLNTWKTVGYSMVVYMATITGFDPSLYESAVIDGASKWQQIKGITLPLLRPVISIMFIMNLGHIFNTDIGLFYLVPQAMVPTTTWTLDVYVYNAVRNADFRYSAAASLMQNVIGCILVLTTNAIVKKLDPDSGLL